MTSRWLDSEWQALAHDWIDTELERLTRNRVGPIEQPHVEIWSKVMRVPTDHGSVWFKANTQTLRYESAIVERLSALRADLVPPLLATDPVSGWMLTSDAGERLREVVVHERSLDRWHRVLARYADLQGAAQGQVQQLLSLGVPDMRLATLPERYADLHDGQVFVRDGSELVMDWGDGCISHPFFTLSVTLEGVISSGLDDVQDSIDVAPFRDSYLKPFLAEYGGRLSHRDLTEAVEIALRLGWACRAVNGHVSAVITRRAG